MKMEPVLGFEPRTDGLQNRCSTTELNWPPPRPTLPEPFSPRQALSSHPRDKIRVARCGKSTTCADPGGNCSVGSLNRWASTERCPPFPIKIIDGVQRCISLYQAVKGCC